MLIPKYIVSSTKLLLLITCLSMTNNVIKSFSFTSIQPILLSRSSNTKLSLRPIENYKISKSILYSHGESKSSSSSSSSTETSFSATTMTTTLEEAKKLKKQAEKARLEAEQMNAKLTLSKISNLESKLISLQNDLASVNIVQNDNSETDDNARKTDKLKSEKQLLQKRNDLLMELNRLKDQVQSPSSTPSTLKEKSIRMDSTNTLSEVVSRPLQSSMSIVDRKDDEMIDSATSIATENITSSMNSTSLITPETLADAVEGFEKLPPMIQNMIAKSVGLPDGKNKTLVVNTLASEGKMRIVSNEEAQKIEGKNSNNMGIDKVFDSSNDGSDDANKPVAIFELDSLNDEDILEIYKEDLEYDEISQYVEAILPKRTRKYEDDYESEYAPTEEDLDFVYKNVLGMKTFNPTSKPEMVPGGFIIRGENRLIGAGKEEDKLSSSDAIIQEIDEKLMKCSPDLANKLLFCYMKDPTPFEEPEIDMGQELEEPVLLVLSKDLELESNKYLKLASSTLSLLSVSLYALGTYAIGEGNIAKTDDILAILDGIQLSIVAILGIQMIHELGHRIIAFRDKVKDKLEMNFVTVIFSNKAFHQELIKYISIFLSTLQIEIGLPTAIPSINTGFMGCITPIKTSPKNLNSLFDFAIAGPLLGFSASLASLVYGLQKTVETYSAGTTNTALSTLPALPVDFLRSSSLAGGIVEMFLGSGALLSADPANTSIALHPFAIAGYIGIIVNALNLLPIGSKFFYF